MTELDVIRNATDNDFEEISKYQSIAACSEVVRLEGFGSYSSNDNPAPMLNKATGWIWFKTKKNGMIPFFRAMQDGKEFVLYQMKYNSYNKFGF